MLNHIVNWQTYSMGVHNAIGETNEKPSKTVPGMAESLHSLLARLVRGENVTVYPGTYTGDDESIPDDLERMDFSQRLELAGEIKDHIASHQRRRQPPKVEPGPSKDETDKNPKSPLEGGTTDGKVI